MINQSPFKSFRINIAKSSEKFVLTIPNEFQKKISDNISALKCDNEYSKLKIKKLSGHKNLYRIKVDDYRIVYSINKSKEALNIIIAHRKNVYAIIKNKTFS